MCTNDNEELRSLLRCEWSSLTNEPEERLLGQLLISCLELEALPCFVNRASQVSLAGPHRVPYDLVGTLLKALPQTSWVAPFRQSMLLTCGSILISLMQASGKTSKVAEPNDKHSLLTPKPDFSERRRLAGVVIGTLSPEQKAVLQRRHCLPEILRPAQVF
jgi:hypothetical protein